MTRKWVGVVEEWRRGGGRRGHLLLLLALVLVLVPLVLVRRVHPEQLFHAIYALAMFVV